METNYYFMSRSKELMQTCFAEKSEWGVFGEEYTIVDEPYLGYRCHLNKLSCGWRPLFQKHRAFDGFRKLEAFYREHQADLELPFGCLFGNELGYHGGAASCPDYLFDWTEGEFV